MVRVEAAEGGEVGHGAGDDKVEVVGAAVDRVDPEAVPVVLNVAVGSVHVAQAGVAVGLRCGGQVPLERFENTGGERDDRQTAQSENPGGIACALVGLHVAARGGHTLELVGARVDRGREIGQCVGVVHARVAVVDDAH